MAELKAICISEKKGTQKHEVESAFLQEDFGIENDAHAGKWHRQVSLLSYDKIREFKEKGAEVENGAFGENLIIDGFDFRTLPVGTRFRIGDALLEMTQIGKECHSHCAIYHAMGDCIMPREGVFTKVLHSGTIKKGDAVEMLPPDPDRPYTAAIITLSDKGSRGEREDVSGGVIEKMLLEAEEDIEIVERLLLPDGIEPLSSQLIRLADQRQVNLILTTGGTGFSPRDLTPEATTAVCDRMVPGIAEAMRAYSMTITKRGMLSRQVSGLRKNTLIINLPGSPKAVRENLECILPALGHGLEMMKGASADCAAADTKASGT